MAGEIALPAPFPFENTIALASARPELDGDIVATAEYLAESLDARAEIIRIGLLGMAEIEGYYEGGLPEDVRNSLFLLYLSYQNIELTNMVSGLYGDRFSRDQFANASHLLREIRTSTDQEIAFARGRYMYFTGQQQPAVARQKQAAVAHAEHLIDTGENIDSVDDFLRNMGIDSDTIDGRAIRSKRAVEAQMLPTADETLVALSRLGYSDAGIFRRLAIATGNFAHVGETDFGTYAMQVRAAIRMLSEGEQEEVIKGVVGLSDDDFTALADYVQTQRPEVVDAMSQEFVEMAKSGISVNQWYKQMREKYSNNEILANPVYANRILAYVEQKLRDKELTLDYFDSQRILPYGLLKQINRSVSTARESMYEEFLGQLNPDGSNVFDIYRQLRKKKFRVIDILNDHRIRGLLDKQILSLLNEKKSWKEIKEDNGIEDRTLEIIVGGLINDGGKQARPVGWDAFTSEQWADLESRVQAQIEAGVIRNLEIAEQLQVDISRVREARKRLREAKKIGLFKGRRSSKKLQLEQSLNEWSDMDGLDRLDELLDQAYPSFIIHHPDLFVSLGSLAKRANLRYYGNQSRILSAARESGVRVFTIEHAANRKGKRIIQRQYYVFRKLADSMIEHFLSINPENI